MTGSFMTNDFFLTYDPMTTLWPYDFMTTFWLYDPFVTTLWPYDFMTTIWPYDPFVTIDLFFFPIFADYQHL